ncbi:membrane-bound transcription factor site-1 protease-like [Schistocerca gregaria]|uniref:membrane-bound transcription factor site-1 protease-like n=1 Tax=Schistocerca gregaria TaxID=7010 RepID=UPI00211E3011|nr:membrane-bound transcription factor site-1 protease-like [Schistocerca gregaria]
MPFTCFEASLYSTILIVDPEEEFFADEIEKLKIDLKQNGLSLALFADWYDENVMREKSYFDDNMKHWINPITAGSNIPAINQLLLDFDIQLGNNVYIGHIKIASQMTYYASGTSIARFPKNGVLYFFSLIDESKRYLHKKRVKATVPVLGLYSIPSSKDVNGGFGRIAIFGDSSCLVSSFQDCLLLFSSILDFTSKGISPALSIPGTILVEDFIHDIVSLPQRIPGNRHFLYSKLSGSKPNCSVTVMKNDLLEKSNLEAVL